MLEGGGLELRTGIHGRVGPGGVPAAEACVHVLREGWAIGRE